MSFLSHVENSQCFSCIHQLNALNWMHKRGGEPLCLSPPLFIGKACLIMPTPPILIKIGGLAIKFDQQILSINLTLKLPNLKPPFLLLINCQHQLD